ncbi:MAG: hypothetical protein J6O19_09570 [Lachnospira sp.]|nr:hypothetical protein [Lachnospira sp.]
MVGGDENTFEKYKEILFKMGSSVTRCGELGAGNTTKLANQIIVEVIYRRCQKHLFWQKRPVLILSVSLRQ